MNLIVFILLWLGVNTLAQGTAGSAEDIAFNAASRGFQDGFFEKAEKDFADFARFYPNSERVAEAILLQAQCLFRLARYDETLKLLDDTYLTKYPRVRDRSRYWIAEAYYQKGKYAEAAGIYGVILKDHPDSFIRSGASFGEAMAHFKMGQVTNTIHLLQNTNGYFHKISLTQTNDEFVLRGLLLLGEALLQTREFQQAESVLEQLGSRSLTPQLVWKRQALLARLRLAAQRPDAALQGLTNLLLAASATGLPEAQAEAALLHGEMLQASGQWEAARQVYEKNKDSLPPDYRRGLLLRLADIYLALTNSAAGIQVMETFLAQFPKDAVNDQANLILGDLRLQSYYALRQSTNPSPDTLKTASLYLQNAQTNFAWVLTNFPASPSVGKAHLSRGRCFWEAENYAEAAKSFQAAFETLQSASLKALARCKWADALFALGNYAEAEKGFGQVVEQYGALPGLPDDLLQEALFQWVRASSRLDHVGSAGKAMEMLLGKFPASPLTERSLLLHSQMLNRLNRPVEARGAATNLLYRFPQSSLEAEARLEMAQSYITEKNWAHAFQEYDQWVSQFTNHSALPLVLYDRAWIYEQGGQEAKAAQLYKDFMTRYPHHPLAAQAQLCIGNYHFNQGQYTDAEAQYQQLYQKTNNPNPMLALQARLSAGRTAYARQNYKEADSYFKELINLLEAQTNSPPDLLAQAFFALGDTFAAAADQATTNRPDPFGDAINAFRRVPEQSRYAPLAWARIGDCHFQKASGDPARYTNAISYYRQAVTATNSPRADIATRSQAEIGIAQALEGLASKRPPAERAALRNAALDHYLNVIHERNLLPGEIPSAFWMDAAGLNAARLLESEGKWAEATAIYDRMIALFPKAKSKWEKKLEAARRRL